MCVNWYSSSKTFMPASVTGFVKARIDSLEVMDSGERIDIVYRFGS